MAPKKMRVRAFRLGFYGLERRREKDVFDLRKPEDFDATWMEEVNPKTALHRSKIRPSGPRREQHEGAIDDARALAETRGEGVETDAATGSADVMGD